MLNKQTNMKKKNNCKKKANKRLKMMRLKINNN